MDERTLAALKGSIAKWEKIVAGTGTDDGEDNCPLCKLFRTDRPLLEYCLGCPVSERTGTGLCRDTPYIEWSEETGDAPCCKATTKKQKKAAQAELDFLRSLLPVEACAQPSAESGS